MTPAAIIRAHAHSRHDLSPAGTIKAIGDRQNPGGAPERAAVRVTR